MSLLFNLSKRFKGSDYQHVKISRINYDVDFNPKLEITFHTGEKQLTINLESNDIGLLVKYIKEIDNNPKTEINYHDGELTVQELSDSKLRHNESDKTAGLNGYGINFLTRAIID